MCFQGAQRHIISLNVYRTSYERRRNVRRFVLSSHARACVPLSFALFVLFVPCLRSRATIDKVCRAARLSSVRPNDPVVFRVTRARLLRVDVVVHSVPQGNEEKFSGGPWLATPAGPTTGRGVGSCRRTSVRSDRFRPSPVVVRVGQYGKHTHTYTDVIVR